MFCRIFRIDILTAYITVRITLMMPSIVMVIVILNSLHLSRDNCADNAPDFDLHQTMILVCIDGLDVMMGLQ